MAHTLPLVPAAGFAKAELAELFNRAYAGYFVPLHVDEAALAFMVELNDLVLDASRVAMGADGPVGLAMLGVRGKHGWVGGMGVVPEARRTGVGERLMRALIEEAAERGLTTLDLEVLEQNDSARRLYSRLGFREVRTLEVWTLPAPATRSDSPAAAADPADAVAWLREHARAPEPWQRGDGTLQRLRAREIALEALAIGDGDERAGALLYRVADGRASVLRMAVREEAVAHDLIDAVLARPDVSLLRYLNVPASDPAARALRARGAALEALQLEMTLPLGDRA